MQTITVYNASVNPPVPVPGATPVFVAYRDRFGADRMGVAPVIRNLGGGLYGFDPSAADEAIGVGFIVDAGAGNSPRYSYGAIGNVAVFFALFDSNTGAPLATATPSISTYKKPDASSASPVPTVLNAGGGVYTFTPSDSDRVYGVAFEGASGHASAWPPRFGGVVSDPVITSSPSASPPPDVPTATLATARKRDLAFDFKTGKFVLSKGDFTFTSDLEAIRQAVQIRCQTFLGEWFLDLDAGIPYFQNVFVKSPNVAAIRQVFKSKIESVPGVLEVTKLDLDYNRSTRQLRIDFAANTDFGELAGTITPPVQ